MKVPCWIVEERLLEGIKSEPFTPEAIDLFKRETTRLLTEHRRAKRPDTEVTQRQLARIEKEIERIVAAITDGAYSTTLKAELTKKAGERERLGALLKVDTSALGKIGEFIPRAMDRYRKLADDLPNALGQDVQRARAQIKTLLGGSIKLTRTNNG